MFALGNATFACGVRSARERSFEAQSKLWFEEASGETEVGRRSLQSLVATVAAGAGVTPTARQPNFKLNQRPPRALFCLKPRASEAGVCRGSDTPTIHVGDIDMYNPPRKT